MNGLTVFAGKEAREILRTWRIWVLPGILSSSRSPNRSSPGSPLRSWARWPAASSGGLKLPPATYLDAYTQWIKNLSQIALIALIIIYRGIVSAESKSGTAVRVLTKPVSRTAFVIAKAPIHSVFLTILVISGTLLIWGLTAVVFGRAPGSTLWSAALVWLVFGVLFIALMTLLCLLIGSAAGAAGSVTGCLCAGVDRGHMETSRLLFTCVTTNAASLADGTDVAVLWPVLTAILLAVALVAVAAWAFRREDL